MTLNEAFRNNLKIRRVSCGMTQKELAKRAGYDANYLWKVEKGLANPTLFFVECVSSALCCSPFLLLGE